MGNNFNLIFTANDHFSYNSRTFLKKLFSKSMKDKKKIRIITKKIKAHIYSKQLSNYVKPRETVWGLFVLFLPIMKVLSCQTYPVDAQSYIGNYTSNTFLEGI